MKSCALLILVLITFLLGGCGQQQQLQDRDTRIAALQQQVEEKNQRIANLEAKNALWEPAVESQGLLFAALKAVQYIKTNDLASLSSLVHPSKGLRFTPYPHVDLQKDKVFTSKDLTGLTTNTTVYQWGVYDGKGDPIKLTYNDYYRRFVYDHDFLTAPMLGTNHSIGTGNTIDNVKQAYPAGKFVEFYFPGFDPQYAGIDWSSLKLVFEQQNGTWYLVGIIHGQWTI